MTTPDAFPNKPNDEIVTGIPAELTAQTGAVNEADKGPQFVSPETPAPKTQPEGMVAVGPDGKVSDGWAHFKSVEDGKDIYWKDDPNFPGDPDKVLFSKPMTFNERQLAQRNWVPEGALGEDIKRRIPVVIEGAQDPIGERIDVHGRPIKQGFLRKIGIIKDTTTEHDT